MLFQHKHGYIRDEDGAGNTAEENSSVLQTFEGTFRRQKVT